MTSQSGSYGRRFQPFLVLLFASLGALAHAADPCQVFVDNFENQTRGDGRLCPGDRLRYQVCVKSESGSSPQVVWNNSIPRDCFASVSWFVPPASSDTSCTKQPTMLRDGSACAQNFSVPVGGTTCGLFDAVLLSVLPEGTNCTIEQVVQWDPTSSCTNSDTRTIVCPPANAPDVRLSKVIEGVDPALNENCSAAVLNEGDTVVFRMEVRNNSPDGDDTSVVVSDDLPAGLTNFQLLEPACTPCQVGCSACFEPLQGINGRLTVDVDAMARGTTQTIRFSTLVAPSCGTGTWSFANQAQVSSDWIQANVPGGVRVSDNRDGDSMLDEPTCSGPIPHTESVSVAVAKSVDRTSASPGDTVHFQIRFDATPGACSVTGTLRDDIPAGISLVPASVTAPASWTVTAQGPPAGANGGGFVSVDDAIIDGGNSLLVEFDAVIDLASGCNQPLANQASYALSSGSGVATAARIAITNPTPDVIQVTKDSDKLTATLNDVVTWTVHILNLSACPIVGGVLADSIPAGFVLDLASITQSLPGPVNASVAGLVRFTGIDLDAVAPGNELTVTYSARVDGSVAGLLTNTAEVTYVSTSGSDSASVDVQLTPSCASAPVPVTGLLAVEGGAGADVVLSWQNALNATTYNVFKVIDGDAQLIPVANLSTSLSNPSVVAVAGCQGVPDAARTCTDFGAISTNPPGLLFYQIRGVCSDGLTQGDLHPF